MSAVMDLGMSERVKPLVEKIRDFTRNFVAPLDHEFHELVGTAPGGRFSLSDRQNEILDTVKDEARKRGLWNFWLTDSEEGFGLSTVEYAYIAEELGWVHLASEAMNCSAPDTGNMEVLERYGTEGHKKQWLKPLLEGKIRSAYLMTEPDVASSDATNLEFLTVKDGDEWVLNGEKYWSSGAGDERCKVYILMAKTPDESRTKHQQHSMFVIDAATPGIEILRPMMVFGHDDAPHGHMHIRFTNVRIPADALLIREGAGFEVSQGRLGPGRIHHCMRSIGQSEKALELLCKRSLEREAFGKQIAFLGANFDIIAEARIKIEQARLLCLKAAWAMDTMSKRDAAPWISMIKVEAPRMSLKVIDEAMQMYGGTGVSQDTPLAAMYQGQRTLRFADGPDAVHRRQVARKELRAYTNQKI